MKLRLNKFCADDWIGAIGVWILISAANYMVWKVIFDIAKMFFHWIDTLILK